MARSWNDPQGYTGQVSIPENVAVHFNLFCIIIDLSHKPNISTFLVMMLMVIGVKSTVLRQLLNLDQTL